MKLYYAPGACSLAPHIALREADRRFDLERVDLRTHRTAGGRDYREINPKGYVPTLELDGSGSDTLTEAQVILQYIGDLAPDRNLIPPSGTFARYHAQEWLAFLSSEVHKLFSPLFKPNTPPSVQSDQRGRISQRLQFLEEALADRGFLTGESFSVVDAYLFVLLRWCEKFGIDLPMWPRLDDYAQRIAQRPAVQAALGAEGLLSRRRHLRSA